MRSIAGMILICLTCFTGYSQLTNRSSALHALHKKKINSGSPRELANSLTENLSTEMEKVRAIFDWITSNIEYMVRPVRNKRTQMIDDNDTVYRSLDERVAITVLEKRVAVCEGYSRLFKTLCEFAGIRSEIIHGYANGGRSASRFGSNHTWNAVLIDNEWKLIDVTWASGFVTWRGDYFVQELDERYFMPSPRQFIRDHYPDNIQWTLLEEPPIIPEFNRSPFLQRSFGKYQLKGFSPANGIIEVSPGDILEFELVTTDIVKDRQIGSDPFLNLDDYNNAHSAAIKPVTIKGNKIYYLYEVVQIPVQWLYIVYNDDLILRYSLKPKSE